MNSHKTPSTGGGTIYAGSASSMGSSRATTTSASVAPSLNNQTSSRVGYSPSVAPSGAAIAGKRAGGFNPNAYGSPGRRSPTGSLASESTARSGSTFAKIKKGRTVIDMDAAREQHKDMRHEAAKKAKAMANDVEVSDSESD